MVVSVEKPLPGELEGTIDPEDYGFGVIKLAPPDKAETAERIREFYARVKKRTGVVIPELERFLHQETPVN